MRYLFLASAAAALVAPTNVPAQNAEQRIEWNKPAEPFRIVDNVYYVGTKGLAAYLITGSRGHILIDGGLPESAPLIAANIRQLGFEPADIEYLLINHAHFDHSGGLAELKRLTGAKVVAVAAERPDLEAGRTIGRPELGTFPAVKVDRIVRDRGQLRLGDTVLTAHLTAGHTRGCTSWSGRAGKYTILFACSLTVAGQNLIDDNAYPEAAEDFRRTFDKLAGMKADIFLNFHPEFFDMEGKRTRQKAGASEAFVDPGELPRQVERARQGFLKELERQRGN
jgi:metallo-beta-lactamase class B